MGRLPGLSTRRGTSWFAVAPVASATNNFHAHFSATDYLTVRFRFLQAYRIPGGSFRTPC